MSSPIRIAVVAGVAILLLITAFAFSEGRRDGGQLRSGTEDR